MASNSSKKNKSSGMRILWIPGRKSHHPKGRYNTTNKNISYSSQQKKSEVWSLGGSKAQTELIDFPSPEVLDNASSSSLAIATTYSLIQTVKDGGESLKSGDSLSSADYLAAASECATLPVTPITTTSSNLSSPLSELAPSTPSTKVMSSPVVVTTVEIRDLHNILNPDDLPKIPLPPTGLGEMEGALNSSAGTTASIATNSSPTANRKAGEGLATTPQKAKYKNHNNNQEDINSIESISSFQRQQVSSDFEWIDEMVQQRNCNETMHKNKRKKSKKTSEPKTDSDQVDATKMYEYQSNADAKSKAPSEDNDADEKVVKCLYYSLMCCDCTIS